MSGLSFGRTGCPTRAFSLFGRMTDWKEVSKILSSLRHFDESEIAKQRLKIIKFYDKYGEKATKEAFGVDRKLIYIWRKKLKQGKGKLSSLVPFSTRPERVRRMMTDGRIVEFIKKLREEHPRLGKEKIKPLLDEYCDEVGISSIKESTIGKVIKRNNLFFQKSNRVYHDPASGWAQRKKKKRLRVRYSPKHQELGHLQADSITLFTDGLKRYIFSAIDSKLKFSFSLCYKSLNSRNGQDFFRKLERVYPFRIKSLQTDNGLEFLGEFDEYLRKKNIPHFFSYPRCPKINGVVERYQRSLQEEFANWYLEIIDDTRVFNQKMIEYLIWYNTRRVHQSLGLKSPMDYLLFKGLMSKKCVTSTGT